MEIEDFTHTADIWIRDLKKYSFDQLCIKPAPKSWSLGQLYNHVIKATNYYCGQIKICTATDEHVDEEIQPGVQKMFQRNAMPDIIIKGPPSNDLTPQPQSKNELLSDLTQIKIKMKNMASLIDNSTFSGKTKHAMLNYLNAKEWFQLADIHMRHHLSQKARIEAFLKENGHLAVEEKKE